MGVARNFCRAISTSWGSGGAVSHWKLTNSNLSLHGRVFVLCIFPNFGVSIFPNLKYAFSEL